MWHKTFCHHFYLQKSSKSSAQNSIVLNVEFEVVSSNSEVRGPTRALMRTSRLQGRKEEALLAADTSRFRLELKTKWTFYIILSNFYHIQSHFYYILSNFYQISIKFLSYSITFYLLHSITFLSHSIYCIQSHFYHIQSHSVTVYSILSHSFTLLSKEDTGMAKWVEENGTSCTP